jgi:ADP-heptose:LPS heptosyltransferase
MKTGIFLSYSGLGTNILHLSYCHEIAKKIGPVHLITLSPKIGDVLNQDSSFKEVIYLDKFHKRFIDIFKLSKFLKKLKLDSIFIFYPSLRYVLSCKLAGINKVYHYPIYKKKKLHLVDAAKEFTEKSLNIKNCPTETKIIFDEKILKEYKKNTQKKIILGIGSSGPTTKWGYDNFSNLIKKLNTNNNYYFYLLCGSDEEEGAQKIIKNVGNYNCESLANKSISEIIYYIASSEMYVGNDSFGHHIACQMNKPCYIILLDSPKAYSDYSKNQNRILPTNINIEKIDHGSRLNPDSVSVEMVIDKIKNKI